MHLEPHWSGISHTCTLLWCCNRCQSVVGCHFWVVDNIRSCIRDRLGLICHKHRKVWAIISVSLNVWALTNFSLASYCCCCGACFVYWCIRFYYFSAAFKYALFILVLETLTPFIRVLETGLTDWDYTLWMNGKGSLSIQAQSFFLTRSSSSLEPQKLIDDNCGSTNRTRSKPTERKICVRCKI